MILAAAPLVAKARAVLASVPAWVWVGACMVLALCWFGANRFHAGELAERARQEKAQAASVAKAVKAKDKAETKQAGELADVGTQLGKTDAKALAERDGLIRDLRSDNVRLRERFKCTPGPSLLPEAAGATTGRDGEAPGGLSNPDAEFLIRLAADADAVANQLAACQATIAEYRK